MKPRTGPPPVDQLPDVAWARVERELWTRLDHSAPAQSPDRRRWMWVAASIAAAAAVAIAIAIGVAVRSPGAATDDEPARIVAGASPSSVSFGDAHIALDARSVVVMEADRHTALLENGAAWFAVGPRGDRPAFVVHAGDATVRVIGTRFRVARDRESVSVAVDHGVVAVDFHGSHVELGAGRSWSSTAPDTVAIASPHLEVPAVVAPVPPIPPATPLPPPSAQIAPKPTPACDADCVHYKALAKLEATRPEVAIKGYLSLSQGSGTWAAVALFAAGRLAADRHDPRAPSLLSIYLSRFPSGANAADATELLARLKGTTP